MREKEYFLENIRNSFREYSSLCCRFITKEWERENFISKDIKFNRIKIIGRIAKRLIKDERNVLRKDSIYA